MAGLWYLHYLLWLLASYGDCQSVITMTPSSLSLAAKAAEKGGVVTVKCEPAPLATGDFVLVMSILRQLEDENNSTVIVSATEKRPDPVMRENITGALVFGSVPEGFITLKLTQAKCADIGLYICRADVFLKSGSAIKEVSSLNLTVSVQPGVISLISDQPGKKNWVVHDTVRILCNASLGIVHCNTESAWIWQYRDSREPHSAWEDYEADEDIEDAGRASQICYEVRSSRLTRVLTYEDDWREYRCYINLAGFPYPKYSGIFSVGTVNGGTGTSKGDKIRPKPLLYIFLSLWHLTAF